MVMGWTALKSMQLVRGWWIPMNTFPFHFHLSTSPIEFSERQRFFKWWFLFGGGCVQRGGRIECPIPWVLNWCHYHMNSTQTKNSVRLWVTDPQSQQRSRYGCCLIYAASRSVIKCSHIEICHFVYPGNRLLLSDKKREAGTRCLSAHYTHLCCNAVICARDRPRFSANACLSARLY